MATPSASATVAPFTPPAPLSVDAIPRMIWDRITPLFPRAPISDP